MDEAIEAAVQLTDAYVTDRRRPDKAIDALDEACAHTQAVSKYPARAETLMRDRVQRLRQGGRTQGRSGPGQGDTRTADPENGRWDQMARDGMTALERFGAEIEKMFGSPDETPPNAPPRTPPKPEPPPEPVTTLGEIETELGRVLAEEGIVVRGHDVARVVALMSGREVTWPPVNS